MRLYIPNLGDDLVLSRDWTFKLYGEHRNSSLWVDVFDGYNSETWKAHQYESNALYQKYLTTRNTEDWKAYNDYRYDVVSLDCTIPIGSTLRVDRIYIRKGQDDFSSVTFYLVDTPSRLLKPSKKMPRFWAKLDDVNTMEII